MIELDRRSVLTRLKPVNDEGARLSADDKS
jgi:hypothetical protein